MAHSTRRPSHARGFLFADLRGYTAFVEARGNAAAAELLRSYRAGVREVIARFDGAEIRTEGDSFYVVFPSASDAILAGLAILEEGVAGAGGGPVGIGVGVHAGEATETDEGYVGWAVNVAARLCALAGRGELLVSETARGITHGQLDVRFTPRGRKRLKGIAEPVAVYAVTPGVAPLTAASSSARLRALRRRLNRAAVPLALAIGVLILTAGGLVIFGRSLVGQAQQQTPSPAAATTATPAPVVAAESPTQQPTATEAATRAEHEDRLRARIDPDVARLCVSAEPDEAPVTRADPIAPLAPLPTVGGLRCDLGGGAAPDTVYYWEATHEIPPASSSIGSQGAFATLVGERNIPPGDCSTDTRGWSQWEFGAAGGKVLCSRFGGPALIAWTYEGTPIIGLAEREDGDSARLYRWWEEHARTLGPEPGA